MNTKLIKSNNNNKTLTVFLTGWGCDDNQFKNLTCDNDLVLCWDYSDLNIDFDFSKYEKFYLYTYSAGVFVANFLKNKLPKFEKTIAINGNPLMFDKKYGIEESILKQMHEINEENCFDFIKKYLTFDEEDYKYFIDNPSLRSFESSEFELRKLEEYSKQEYTPFEYDLAILSDSDKIFNPETQKEYFKNYEIFKNSAHTIFSKFKKL